MNAATNVAALPQASPEHNAIGWLEEAVSKASEDCTETYRSPDWSYEHIHQQTLIPWIDGQLLTRFDAYDDEPSSETKAWWSTTIFSVDMLLADKVSLTQSEDRLPAFTNANNVEAYTWSCHELKIALTQPAPYTSADGEPDEIEILSFEVNDWSLGEKMLAPFQRLAEGEAGTAKAPL